MKALALEAFDVAAAVIDVADPVAGPGEVYVSGTTRDLLDGSGLQLEDRGAHELKGLVGARPVYALVRP